MSGTGPASLPPALNAGAGAGVGCGCCCGGGCCGGLFSSEGDNLSFSEGDKVALSAASNLAFSEGDKVALSAADNIPVDSCACTRAKEVTHSDAATVIAATTSPIAKARGYFICPLHNCCSSRQYKAHKHKPLPTLLMAAITGAL